MLADKSMLSDKVLGDRVKGTVQLNVPQEILLTESKHFPFLVFFPDNVNFLCVEKNIGSSIENEHNL